MKNYIIAILILIPGACFSQFSKIKIDTKAAIRPINLKINKNLADKINNSSSEADNVEYRDNGNLKTIGKEYFLTLINPNNIPILFATGTNDFMNIQTVESNSVFHSKSVDYWQNVAINTDNKQLVYSIKTNNCYAFFWNTSYQAWDLKKIKCDAYETKRRK